MVICDFMPQLPRTEINVIVERLNVASTPHEKGKAFEDLFCVIFKTIPGIEIAQRNIYNIFNTEEVDVALWNNKQIGSLDFLPNIILVECKNWSNAVGSAEISYFKEKLAHRDCTHGILLAANGITGDPTCLTAAHYEMAFALANKIKIIIIKFEELIAITETGGLIDLLKKRLLELALTCTNF